MTDGEQMHRTLSIERIDSVDEETLALLLLADPDRDAVDRYIRAGDGFRAKADGALAGVAVLLGRGEDEAELMNIAVVPARQGLGIGKILLRHVIDHARAAGFRSMMVGTGNWPVGVLAFYQRAGFRMTGIDPHYFPRHYPEPIVEDGIQCRDRVILHLDLTN